MHSIPILLWFGEHTKRNDAFSLGIIFNGKHYKTARTLDYGKIHPNVFIKLVRQYFANLSETGNNIFQRNDVPFESIEDKHNVEISCSWNVVGFYLNIDFTLKDLATNEIMIDTRFEAFDFYNDIKSRDPDTTYQPYDTTLTKYDVDDKSREFSQDDFENDPWDLGPYGF